MSSIGSGWISTEALIYLEKEETITRHDEVFHQPSWATFKKGPDKMTPPGTAGFAKSGSETQQLV